MDRISARLTHEWSKPGHGIAEFPNLAVCTGLATNLHATIIAMASARKPVIVRKFSRDWSAGYADGGVSLGSTECEILDVTGKVLRIPWTEVKWV